jgi:hypothetical protein
MEKRCTKCKQVKPLTEFDRRRSRKNGEGRVSYCMACRREMRNAQYMPHPKPRTMVEKGQRFGRLTVVEETAPRSNSRRVICVCDCGTETNTMLASLIKGETTSCGCYHRELMAERNRSAEQRAQITTHGLTKHPLYNTWRGMIDRCGNPDHHAFKNYGGRGIKVCAEWHDPAAFIAWVEANIGPRPAGMTLDRVDNSGPYAPGKVRWATLSEQRRNRRSREQCDADAARLAAVRT